MFAFVLLNLFVLFNENEAWSLENNRRLFYGDDAFIEDYPYFAGLDGCGASILSDIWLVTAAHCVDDPVVRGPREVYVGGNSIGDSIWTSYSDFIVHPGYQKYENKTLDDIALLRLIAPLQFSDRIQPINLPTGPPTTRNLVLVARGKDESGTVLLNLKKANRELLTTPECRSALSPDAQAELAPQLANLQTMFLCSVSPDNRPSTCHGDSGSPLADGSTLVGMVSQLSNICHQGVVTLDVNVFNYVPWIRAQTGL